MNRRARHAMVAKRRLHVGLYCLRGWIWWVRRLLISVRCLQGCKWCVSKQWLLIDDYSVCEVHLFWKPAISTAWLIWTFVPCVATNVGAHRSHFTMSVSRQVLEDSPDLVVDDIMLKFAPTAIFAVFGSMKVELITESTGLFILKHLAL